MACIYSTRVFVMNRDILKLLLRFFPVHWQCYWPGWVPQRGWVFFSYAI